MDKVPASFYRCPKCSHRCVVISHGDAEALCPDHGPMLWTHDRTFNRDLERFVDAGA